MTDRIETNEINELDEQIAYLKSKIKDLEPKIAKLEAKKEKLYIDAIAKDKSLFVNLKEHAGTYPKEITMVLKDNKGKVFFKKYTDEFKIREDGYFYFSSLNAGIVEYNKKESCYIDYFYSTENKLDVLGFINIIPEEEDS